MLNKCIFSALLFLCAGLSLFAQDSVITGKETNNFFNNFYWYQKYLPPESVSEFYAVRNTLVSLKDNNREMFDSVSDSIGERIHSLDTKVYDRLAREMSQKDDKIHVLITRYGSIDEIQELSSQYTLFKTIIAEHGYPEDDRCLDAIEECYSRLITRSGYRLLNQKSDADERLTAINKGGQNQTGRLYVTKEGDYFRKIALDPSVYNNELYWKLIYTVNKEALPNPNNPDLLYPGITLQIPPLSAEVKESVP